MSKRIYETTLAGRPLTLETGELAQFANGAVLCTYGDTTVLTTVTASTSPREGIDFFPLSVDYEEKMYSIGKIPGGFFKREGKPSENAILTGRSIDRPIRPLFPKDLRNDVVVNNLVLSVDGDNSPQVAALIATSAALSISDIPWRGPVAGVKVGIVDDEIVINPNAEQTAKSVLDLFVAGTKTKVCMIEAGANEVKDERMLDAIQAGHNEITKLCDLIQQMKDEIGKAPFDYVAQVPNADVYAFVKENFWNEMRQAILSDDKSVRDKNIGQMGETVIARLTEAFPDTVINLADLMDKLQKDVVRDYLKNEHKRVDGRALDEIRPLSAAVDVIPRVHGSGLFQRGQTQVLTLCTLGTLSNAQKLDGVDSEDRKRYMHHYNFPAYSVGEARPNRSPGRREIGHGALAERSIAPVLPSEEEFPYAIRCVSEILMSNGSTSQASVCASTLALMAAGVPIKRPVAGISSGLIMNPEDESDYLVFMDIQGIEDFFGDMDFKVAGTTEGITGVQVDIKVDGLSMDVIRDAFALTKKGRLQILNDTMIPVIAEPRHELSPYAPKIEQIDIPADKIREVIGSGGKVIRRITEETGTEIDIEEDGPVGHVFIASPNQAAAEEAIKRIKAIALDPEPGTIFDGVVTRLMPFGAFVEIAPGKEGMVHISKMAWSHVANVEDAVEPGQSVRVVVSEVDSQGRLNLSMRDLMEKPEGYVEERQAPRGPRRDGGNRNRGGGDRDRDRGDRSGGRRDRRQPLGDGDLSDQAKKRRDF